MVLTSAALSCVPPRWLPTQNNVRGLPEGMRAGLPECHGDGDCHQSEPVCSAAGSGSCVQGRCLYAAARACDAYDREVQFCKSPAEGWGTSRCSFWVEQFSSDAGAFTGCQEQLECVTASCIEASSGCGGVQQWTERGWGPCVASSSCSRPIDRAPLSRLASSQAATRVGKQIVFVKTDSGRLTAGSESDRRSLTTPLVPFTQRLAGCEATSFTPACCSQGGATVVQGFDWAQLKLTGGEGRRALLCELNNLFSDLDVEFTDVAPPSGDFAILWYVKRDCGKTYLCELCEGAVGVANIDPGNSNPNDLLVVAGEFKNLQQMALAGAHEVGHGLGLVHVYKNGSVMAPSLEAGSGPTIGPSWEAGPSVVGNCSNHCEAGPNTVDPHATLQVVVPLAQPRSRARCDVSKILTGVVSNSRFVEDNTGFSFAIEGVLSQDAPTLSRFEASFPGISHLRVWATVSPNLVTTDYRLLGDRQTQAPGQLFIGPVLAAGGANAWASILGWNGEFSSVRVTQPPEEIARMQTVSGARVWLFGVSTGEGTGCADCGGEGRVAIRRAVEWGTMSEPATVKLCGNCPAAYQPTLDGRCRKELTDDGPLTFDKGTARNVPLLVTRIPSECTMFNVCRYEVQFAQRSDDVYCATDSTVVLNAGCFHRFQNVASPYLVGYGLWSTKWTAAQVRSGLSERLDCTSPDPSTAITGEVQPSYLSFGRGEDGAYSPAGNCVRAIERRRWVIETRNCPAP